MISASKPEIRLLAGLLLLSIVWLAPCRAEVEAGGHLKAFYNYSDYPEDSLLDGPHNPYHERLLNLRLKAEFNDGGWDGQVHYVLNGLNSRNLATCRLGRLVSDEGCLGFGRDDSEVFDLSKVLWEGDNTILAQRIDRLAVGYTSAGHTLRVGRQAISWGNGLAYNPLDLFNPFPPDAIDTEYKAGDDMVYYQFLFANGNDLQGLLIPRRNIVSGDLSGEDSAVAAKMHWLLGVREADLLLARNYGDTSIGGAYGGEWRENVVNANVLVTRTDTQTVLQAVTNYNFSAIWAERNVSGFVELFFNGFGLAGRQHSVADVLSDTDLAERIARGELYTIGRYYLSGGLTIEINPLLQLSPTLFINLGDRSGLLQLVASYSVAQDIDLLVGFNLTDGPAGSEYGGLYVESDDAALLAPANNLFARLAWYF